MMMEPFPFCLRDLHWSTVESIVYVLLFSALSFLVGDVIAQDSVLPPSRSAGLAGKGVLTDGVGHGATEEEAFRQAVVDAVRQVVGTLVSSENVVNNEKVIKDEVLTLSNGFVEKVLKRDKRKLSDGSWEVKLRCFVRKEGVLTLLQDAKVPTVKVDGTSLFADVVSQVKVQKDSAELLSKAFEEFSTFLVAAKMLDTKPRILSRDEDKTQIELNCQAVCDLDRFFSQVAPRLERILDNTCIGKSKELTDSSSRTKRLDISGQKVQTFAPIQAGAFRDNGVDAGMIRSGIGRGADEFTVGLPIKGGRDQKKWSYKVYTVDKRVFSAWPRGTKLHKDGHKVDFLRNNAEVFAVFVDTKGQLSSMVKVGDITFGDVINCDISLLPLIRLKEQGWDGYGYASATAYEWRAAVSVPTSALADIASIKLVVGRPLLYTVSNPGQQWTAHGGPVLETAVFQPGACYCMGLHLANTAISPWNLRLFALKLNEGNVFELFCPSPSSLTPESLEKVMETVRRIEPQKLNAVDWPSVVELMP